MQELALKDGDFMIMMVKPADKKDKQEKQEEQKKQPNPVSPIQNITNPINQNIDAPKKEPVALPAIGENSVPKDPIAIKIGIEDIKIENKIVAKEELGEPKVEEVKKVPEAPKQEVKKEEKAKEAVGNHGNDTQINELTSMGFTKEEAEKALKMASNNVNLALDLICSGEINNPMHNMSPSQNQEMLGALQGINAQGNFGDEVFIPTQMTEIDLETIERLKAMGFNDDEAKKAYFGSNKDVEQAINYLLENAH